MLRSTFADVGGAAPRILAELDEAPMYFDGLGQVPRAVLEQGPRRATGRRGVLRVPVGGGGSSLALIGAYIWRAS